LRNGRSHAALELRIWAGDLTIANAVANPVIAHPSGARFPIIAQLIQHSPNFPVTKLFIHEEGNLIEALCFVFVRHCVHLNPPLI
jgi:hypothetical protein